MKYAVLLVIVVGCAASPEAPASTATFSAATTATHVRASQGNANYGGRLVHKWTVFLSTTEGCAGDTVVSVELDTLSADVAVPLGAIMLRGDLMTIDALPSGFLAYPDTTTTSGTVTINSATASFIVGSFTAAVTVGGTPATYTGTFATPICAGT